MTYVVNCKKDGWNNESKEVKQTSIFSILEKALSTNEQPSSTNSTPSFKNTSGFNRAKKLTELEGTTVTGATVGNCVFVLAECNAGEWLTHSVDKYGTPCDLKCKVWNLRVGNRTYDKGFEHSYLSCKNNRRSTVEDHASDSKPHTTTYSLYLKCPIMKQNVRQI